MYPNNWTYCQETSQSSWWDLFAKHSKSWHIDILCLHFVRVKYSLWRYDSEKVSDFGWMIREIAFIETRWVSHFRTWYHEAMWYTYKSRFLSDGILKYCIYIKKSRSEARNSGFLENSLREGRRFVYTQCTSAANHAEYIVMSWSMRNIGLRRNRLLFGKKIPRLIRWPET